MIRQAWRSLAAEFDALENRPDRARELCAAYARAVLSARDPGRIRMLGAPRLAAAARGELSGRELTAFALLARACERRPPKTPAAPRRP